MKYSICTDAVFAGLDTVSAMTLCKTNGYDAVEFWSWDNKDIAAINEARQALQMEVVTFCTQYSVLNDDAQHEQYLEGLERSIEVARLLETKQLISQVGQRNDLPDAVQLDNIIKGLKRCVPLLEASGITLSFEPLNTRVDHPGYFLESSDVAAQIVAAVGSPHVKMLYDVYHQQISEGDIFRRTEAWLADIGHIHLAGNPGRHEPYFGELNAMHLLNHLEAIGYDGFVGLEYSPSLDIESSLERLRMLEVSRQWMKG